MESYNTDPPSPPRAVITAASSSKVASRFVTETDVKAAQERRKAEWEETYKRMGQEPPPMTEQEDYDPRSLFERLKSNKDKKQEEFEEMIKFKNQFRALDEDEIGFLDSITEEQTAADLEREREIESELSSFRKLVWRFHLAFNNVV
ncbi:hypothetical protein BT69DRAFT_1212110 [Atractiella rhizophila]|nr:hypothetical protein BT69DRAFT_1212110 [Atractiella rhizophila]